MPLHIMHKFQSLKAPAATDLILKAQVKKLIQPSKKKLKNQINKEGQFRHPRKLCFFRRSMKINSKIKSHVVQFFDHFLTIA